MKGANIGVVLQYSWMRPPRSIFADEQPLLLVAVPTPTRRDNTARTLAGSRLPIRVVVWTPQHSPLAALDNAIESFHNRIHNKPIDLAPLPAPDD